jgi:hypothetical protein
VCDAARRGSFFNAFNAARDREVDGLRVEARWPLR